jgi:hypothetical protein
LYLYLDIIQFEIRKIEVMWMESVGEEFDGVVVRETIDFFEVLASPPLKVVQAPLGVLKPRWGLL